MKIGLKLFTLSLIFWPPMVLYSKKDLTVVGSIDFNGSVRRHSIGLIDCLKDKVSINFILTRQCDLSGVSPSVKNIVLAQDRTPADVLILEDPLWVFTSDLARKTSASKIRLAFSVYEADKIPTEWVSTLNRYFDAVIVPDNFLVSVYKNCGVKIPIFMVPLGIYIDEFLALPPHRAQQRPFVFGSTARFFGRKKHTLLIKAFIQEFGNNKNVILRLNGGGKWGSEHTFAEIQETVTRSKVNNIIVTNDALEWGSYVKLMSSFDCFINISSGEGFSITPREALALGTPCILSNNTAQITICRSGFVRPVASNIKEAAYSNHLKATLGDRFSCTVQDVRAALRDMYRNYQLYLNKASQGREWVKQYRWQSLQGKYINFVKPKKVILGTQNKVTNEYLMTNSSKLYKKYQELIVHTRDF